MEHNALEGFIPIILGVGADMPDIGQRADRVDRVETWLGPNKDCLKGSPTFMRSLLKRNKQLPL